MDEHAITDLFVAELRTLLDGLARICETLLAPASPLHAAPLREELLHYLTNVEHLCAGFHVEDCAEAVRAVLPAEPSSAGAAEQLSLPAVGACIEFLHGRLVAVQEAQALDGDGSASAGTARQTYGIGSGDAAEGEPFEELGQEDRAILEAFASAPLRRPTGGISSRVGRVPPNDGEDGASLYPAEAARLRPRPTAAELDVIPPESRRLFLVETADDLQDLRRALVALQQHPQDPSITSTLVRIAHKIKGAGLMVGYHTLAQIAHSLEDLLNAMQKRHQRAAPEAQRLLARSLDLLERALEAAAREEPEDPSQVAQARALVAELERLAGVAPSGAARDPWLAAFAPPEQDEPEHVPSAIGAERYMRVEVRRLDEVVNSVSALALNRAAIEQARHEIGRLQTDLTQAITRLAGVSEHLGELHDAQQRTAPPPSASQPRGTVRAWPFGRKAEHAPLAAKNSATESAVWDDLELDPATDFDQSLRALGEAVADVSTVHGSLRAVLTRLMRTAEAQEGLMAQIQQRVMDARMVAVRELVPRLQLIARGLATDLEKPVSFMVHGASTELDRNISDALAEPLGQLVRNALLHGIESREQRLEMGKPAEGLVWLRAYAAGGEVSLELGDDGQGINSQQLIASALASHILDAETARALNHDEALALMFQPGISTLKHASLAGGRGIGLDDVATAVRALKGSITVHSEVDQGTVFRIHVPTSLSVVQVLQVEAAGQRFAIPFSSVTRPVAFSAGEVLETVGAEPGVVRRRVRMPRERAVVLTRGEAGAEAEFDEVPAVPLAELLGFEFTPSPVQHALVIPVGPRRVAVLVDALLTNHKVVVRTLPPHLRRRGAPGATIMPDGRLLLLLDVPELLAALLTHVSPARTLRPVAPPMQAGQPQILVVDDAVSIRGILDSTLTRAGYAVRMARDGIEGLQMMLEAPPHLVLLDVEMPRLDGFELLAVLRSSPQFSGVRIAMLTSCATEKHQQRARALGADAYLVKPVTADTLVGTVERLLTGAAVPI